MNLMKKNHIEEIVSLAIFAICFVLAIFFPASGELQKFSSAFFFLFFLPFLYIRFILKKDLGDFGLNLRHKRTGIIWSGAMFLVSALIIFILIQFFDFRNNYLLSAYLASKFWAFLLYELVLVNFIFFLQEFFFKGFLLSILEKRFGFLSFFIQGLFFILFLSAGALTWKMAPMIILAFTGGIVAYKSRSFVFAYLMGLVFLIALDAYIIYSFK